MSMIRHALLDIFSVEEVLTPPVRNVSETTAEVYCSTNHRKIEREAHGARPTPIGIPPRSICFP